MPMAKAPKSLDAWVWGSFQEDEKGNIVTEPGEDSGYRCPFPTCNRESKTKRKDRFRDHMRTHKVAWKIPSIKERCSLCRKAFDPNPTKLRMHKNACQVLHDQRGEHEDLVDIDINLNNESSVDPDLINLQDVTDKLKEEKAALEIRFEDAVNEKVALEEENIVLKAKLQRKFEENISLNKEKETLKVQLKANHQEAVYKHHELVEKHEALEKDYAIEICKKDKQIEDLKFHQMNLDAEKRNITVQNEKLEQNLKVEVEKVSQLNQMMDQDLLGKRHLKGTVRNLEVELKDANSKFEIIAIARDELEKQHDVEKMEMVRIIKDGQQKVEHLVDTNGKLNIEVGEAKYATYKQATLMVEVIEMAMKLNGIEKIKADTKEVSLIGEGNFGEVYKAVYNNKEFAIKRNKTLNFQSIQEAVAMSSLDHPNILSVTGIRISTKDIAFGMQLMDSNLDQLLDSRATDKQTGWRRKVVKDTCRAVNYIHEKKILHRDIKPENWLVQYSSFDVKVCLGDFGLAHVGTEATGFYGTRGYMAPEVYEEDRVYTSKVDDWSLGCVLYEVIVNHTLVKVADPVEEELNPKPKWDCMEVDMHREARAIRKLIIVDPAMRKTASDVLDRLF